ncbi:MAG: TlpA family protein disulfide reductase [Bacteroidetes bacterium]|jgi:peroxiredoxin|nr:TlpA family protein disulfide reductase [Bacteroidota bacterium]MBT7144276.1 TlpA family protein disulfide reductase [Bacteroidota bacterium]MBT7492934.1 TlpA family protein disulfide reductase [Bacteroidota bacterium]
MKRLTKIITFCILLILSIQSLKAQENNTIRANLPDVSIKNIAGESVHVGKITNNNNPILICFWKTCCKKPGEYLDAISEVYEDWVNETGVVLYAVAIDDTRSSSRVAPFVNSHGWEFEILLDVNSDLKRAMNVVLTPHTFLLNGKGEIVWQKSMYTYGDEELIYEKISQLVKK